MWTEYSGIAGLMLAGVATLAGYIRARRATTADPTLTLCHD